MRSTVWKTLAFGLTLTALGGCSTTPAEPPPPPLTAEERQLNVESFDVVWETVRDRHYDKDLGGADWDGARAELRPRVEQADSMRDARRIMGELLERLGHSHVGIVPSEAYGASDEGSGGGGSSPLSTKLGYSGMRTFVIDDQLIVTRVSEDSPADVAGVRPGWRVLEADGDVIDDEIARVVDAVESEETLRMWRAFYGNSKLDGDEGQVRTIVFEDGAGERRELSIAFDEAQARPTEGLNLPPFVVAQEDRLIEGRIGYFWFDAFLDPVRIMGRFNGQMRQWKSADGMVIDLRGNLGGIGAMTMGMGGWFVTEKNIKLGDMITRDGQIKFILNPRAGAFEGPLAVLVDAGSVSSAEILAGGLQGIGRARVFGERSAGAALPSALLVLPNGDRLQYVFANYISADGEVLEGKGVVPDEAVALDRASLLEGGDPVLDAAIRWIDSQAAQARGG